MIYLNLFHTVTHWDSSYAHQRVRFYTESPLLTFLLLCMTDAAPTHNTVLQWASCTHVQVQWSQTAGLLWIWNNNNHTQTDSGKHLRVQDLWGVLHNPAPAPDWHPYRLPELRVYLSHLWREGHFHQKLTSWRVGSAVSLFLGGQTAPKDQY